MAKGRIRHQPQRTCIGCREVSTKRELVRLVRTPEGRVHLDPSGKLSGRGAYICRRRSCWLKAKETGALQRALKTAIAADDLQAIDLFFAEMDADCDVDPEQDAAGNKWA